LRCSSTSVITITRRNPRPTGMGLTQYCLGRIAAGNVHAAFRSENTPHQCSTPRRCRYTVFSYKAPAPRTGIQYLNIVQNFPLCSRQTATEQCTAKERFKFLVMFGVPFFATSNCSAISVWHCTSAVNQGSSRYLRRKRPHKNSLNCVRGILGCPYNPLFRNCRARLAFCLWHMCRLWQNLSLLLLFTGP
jgi:hypothetical protein